MKKHLHYLFILDRSGSMASVVKQTIEGINGQIDTLKAETKKHKGKVDITATIMLFDSPSQGADIDYIVLNKPINEVEHVQDSVYIPRGGTPLRDAIGNGITKMKELVGNNIKKKNHTILITILTDGYENSSVEYSHKTIQDTIKELSDTKKWVFTFMGAGGIQEVQNIATSFNIDVSNSLAYDNDAKGHDTRNLTLYRSMSNFVGSMACGSGIAPTTKFFNQTEELK